MRTDLILVAGGDVMKKRLLIYIISVFILIAVGGVVFSYSMLNDIERKELPKTDDELGITIPPVVIEKGGEEKKGTVNIALFGLDARNPDADSRSDSIMVVSIDRDKQSVKVTSFMRDMYVPIPGKGKDKINAAYALDGPALAVKTLNTNFGLDIRNYAAVNFFGLEKLIDKVGGVEIEVSGAEAEVLNNYIKELNKLNGDTVSPVKGGKQVLNGRQAVAYTRIRYVGNGDYERTDRQRRVLELLFKKVKEMGPLKLPSLASAVLPYVETSMSNGDILSLGAEVSGYKTDKLEQLRLPVDGLFKGGNIGGRSVLVPNIEGNREKLHEFIYGAEAK
jgi:polyisoprenyl-teichoic acid--peptidoglycan teichoic acid transferase